MSSPILLTVRPRRIGIYATISAIAVVVIMVVVGLLLRNTDDGVSFQTSDQIGLIGLGLLIGIAIMTMGRPRLRVTREGMHIRNILGETFYPWSLIYRVAFPEGSNWAQLVLPDDEFKPLMAIQAIDRDRAVKALREVRALHAKYAPPPPIPPPARDAELLRQENNRPLGRLELIDREWGEGGKPKRRRRRSS